jgi:DNA-binding CsgD family transcriptional regulator
MMLTQTPTKHNFISTLETSETQSRQSDITLLQRVIESFIDGILILTEQGEWVQSNEHARQICEKLTPGKLQPNSVPEEIWRVCRALIESRSSYPNQPVILESEITTDKQTPLRVRVRWFRLNAISSPCLLVILEDRYESIQNLAIAEVDKYGLTPREAEVWLLHRTNYSHKEIAEELYISLNTVKKHLKNIHAKRKAFATKQAEKLPSWVSQLG